MWTAADKSNKLRAEEPAATSSGSASASAADRALVEGKAQDTARAERRLWADEPIDPRYIGQDIDLDTLTEEQIPELRRRVAVAKEEHERLMQEKRERIAGYARSRDCARGATATEATPARGSREARGPVQPGS